MPNSFFIWFIFASSNLCAAQDLHEKPEESTQAWTCLFLTGEQVWTLLFLMPEQIWTRVFQKCTRMCIVFALGRNKFALFRWQYLSKSGSFVGKVEASHPWFAFSSLWISDRWASEVARWNFHSFLSLMDDCESHAPRTTERRTWFGYWHASDE